MAEFIIIVESNADAQTATKLAERILLERIDWLDPELLKNLFRWSGLAGATEYSCWKDIGCIVEDAKKSGLRVPKYLGHSKAEALRADGATAIKILRLIQFLNFKMNRHIKAVFFIRDLDNQPRRRQGLEQARSENIHLNPELEIIVGTADRMREAWILNGFIPANSKETQILTELMNMLNFDPCREAHRLRSNSWQEPDRIRNPKVIVEQLTEGDKLREQKCWEETSLQLLRERGGTTGLTAYILEVEQRFIPFFIE